MKELFQQSFLMRLCTLSVKRRGVEEAKIRYNSLLVSGLKIEELTNEIAELAGILKCKYSDIPMGDCIIAATAIKNKAKVLSDDDHFDGIEEVKT